MFSDKHSEIGRAHIFGVGGTGSSIVASLAAVGPAGVDLIAVDVHPPFPEPGLGVKTIVIGANKVPRPFCRIPPHWAAEAAGEHRRQFRNHFRENDLTLLAAGLGGGAGTGAVPVIAGICKDAGAFTVAVVSTPFDFEGRKRLAGAEQALDKLKTRTDVTLVISYRALRKMLLPDNTLDIAFGKAQITFCMAIRGLIDIFCDSENYLLDGEPDCIRTVIPVGARGRFGAATAGRLKIAIRKALMCPLLGSETLQTADMLLANFYLAAGTSLKEIHEACDQLNYGIKKGAQVLFRVFEQEYEATVLLFALSFPPA